LHKPRARSLSEKGSPRAPARTAQEAMAKQRKVATIWRGGAHRLPGSACRLNCSRGPRGGPESALMASDPSPLRKAETLRARDILQVPGSRHMRSARGRERRSGMAASARRGGGRAPRRPEARRLGAPRGAERGWRPGRLPTPPPPGQCASPDPRQREPRVRLLRRPRSPTALPPGPAASRPPHPHPPPRGRGSGGERGSEVR
jgi:hypothetical protein